MQDVSSSGLIETTSTASISVPSDVSVDGRFFRLCVEGSQDGGTHTYLKLPNGDGVFDISNIGNYKIDLLCYWDSSASENLSWAGWVTNSAGSSWVVNNGGSGLNGDAATQSDIGFSITQDTGTPAIRQMALSFA